MNFRSLVSLCLFLSFAILLYTGVINFLSEYDRKIATIHTIMGLVFSSAVLFHILNNYKPLSRYISSRNLFVIVLVMLIIFSGAYFQVRPIKNMMDWGAKSKATLGNKTQSTEYEIYKMNMDNDIQLSIDLKRGEHFWHPQVAIWVEDTLGNYLQTLFVTKATARGIFFGGRTKDNFKAFDEKKARVKNDYRRVDALPVWSHKRGIQYEDGLYVPSRETPLPDAITGATPIDNFIFNTSTSENEPFIVKLEMNVAFDDNEFYSEYDFPDDEVYHSGTGQLGQPSIIFSHQVNLEDSTRYYFMDLIGHGHHSGETGELFSDLTKLTTSLELVERIVLSVKIKN